MKIRPIKTRTLIPPMDDLLAVIQKSLKDIPEKSVLVIASKVVSIWQGRCIAVEDYPDKDKLIKKEADKYLPRELTSGQWVMHTIKNNLFIPTAGIDESNAGNYYILWPGEVKKVVYKLWQWLRRTYKVKNFGVIIADSHTTPFRTGVIGISLAYYGFKPLRDYRGKKDLFGRKLKITQTNIVDGLAAAAGVVMGEGAESTPLVLISDFPDLKFISHASRSRQPFSNLELKDREDLYYPLFSALPWKRGRGGK